MLKKHHYLYGHSGYTIVHHKPIAVRSVPVIPAIIKPIPVRPAVIINPLDVLASACEHVSSLK